jgi:LPS sulfotransferase NodH
MSSVIEAGTTPNSVFGVKVLWGQFKSLLDHPECAGLPLPEVVPALFPNPRYIWITRRDKVRQAISLWKASQTDQWHRYADEPAEPVREVRFDFRQIDRRARKIIVDEAAWQEYFHRCGIVPLTVVYEDLVADYEASTRQALEYLAITAPADLPFGPRQLQQQADARSDLWAQRFINQATQQSWLYRALVPGAQSLRQITGQAQARWTGWRKRD